MNRRRRVVGSSLSFAVGVACLWWGVSWLQTTSDSIVPGLDAVLFPLADLVWVPSLGLLFLVGSLTHPLHRRVSRSRGWRGVTLAAGTLLLCVNGLGVWFPLVHPFWGAIYLSPLTATGLFLVGLATTGWLVEAPRSS